jgi:hypothetical protein
MVGLLRADVVSCRSVRVRRRWMGSLIDELKRREAAAGEEAGELRARIAQLAERLARVEERLSRLVIARETVDEVLNEAGVEAPPAAVMPEGTAPSRSGHLSAVGVLAVPPWREGLDVLRCRRATGIWWRWQRMPGARCGRCRSPPRPG